VTPSKQIVLEPLRAADLEITAALQLVMAGRRELWGRAAATARPFACPIPSSLHDSASPGTAPGTHRPGRRKKRIRARWCSAPAPPPCIKEV